GRAGLVATLELARAGHDPILLEARNRVGGRVHTLREPFSHGLYAEVGAMRIPIVHQFTRGYAAHFGLKLNPFTIGNPRTYLYVRGTRIRRSEYAANPALLPFELAQHEAGRTAGQLWDSVIYDLVA